MEQKDLTILREMTTISLDEINEVKLLNRFDSKYWVPLEKLPLILTDIHEDYFVLKIEKQLIQKYKTKYYDTPENCFYQWHHNGKSNRIKIRKREYISTGDAFLEIKQKNNKGKTNKKRIQIGDIIDNLSKPEIDFLAKNTSCEVENLEVKIENTFNRITLINKDFTERCTIDLELNFRAVNDNPQTMEKLAIIELKQGSLNMKTKLSTSLKEHGIYKQGFSKYCIGRALTESSLKKNLFKSQLLQIKQQFALQ